MQQTSRSLRRGAPRVVARACRLVSSSSKPVTAADASVTPADETADLTWLGVTDAAERVGVSIGAIRRWASRREVRSRVGRGPRGERLEVCVEDVADRAEIVVADGDRHPGTELQPLAEQIGALGALIHQAGRDMAEWQAKAQVAETKLAFLGDQLATARADAKRACGENEQLRADSEQLRVELMRARAELTAAHVDTEKAHAELTAAYADTEQTRAELVAARGDSERLRAELGAAREQVAVLQEQVRTATRPLFGRRRAD